MYLVAVPEIESSTVAAARNEGLPVDQALLLGVRVVPASGGQCETAEPPDAVPEC